MGRLVDFLCPRMTLSDKGSLGRFLRSGCVFFPRWCQFAASTPNLVLAVLCGTIKTPLFYLRLRLLNVLSFLSHGHAWHESMAWWPPVAWFDRCLHPLVASVTVPGHQQGRLPKLGHSLKKPLERMVAGPVRIGSDPADMPGDERRWTARERWFLGSGSGTKDTRSTYPQELMHQQT